MGWQRVGHNRATKHSAAHLQEAGEESTDRWGGGLLEEQRQVPKGRGSNAHSSAHYLVPASVVDRLQGRGVSHVRDSSSGVLVGLAGGSGSCPASFDTVSKPDPPASSQKWELPNSLQMLFFLLQVLELDSVLCK